MVPWRSDPEFRKAVLFLAGLGVVALLLIIVILLDAMKHGGL
jgi:hypothetical protein